MEFDGVTVKGASASGVGTCLTVLPYKVVLDIGFCTPDAVACRDVLVSHAHVDHMAGAVQHAASRSLMGLTPSRFVCSPKVGEQLEAVFQLWKQIQGDFKYEIVTLAPGDAPLKLSKSLSVVAVKTCHRIASQGYVLTEARNKLKPEYQSLSGPELGNLAHQGVVLQECHETPVLAFMGDTTPEALCNPLVQAAKTVVTECTFVGTEMTVADAREKGHTHMEELRGYLPGLKCGNLVLMHFSLRHGRAELEEAVQDFDVPYRVHMMFKGDGPVKGW